MVKSSWKTWEKRRKKEEDWKINEKRKQNNWEREKKRKQDIRYERKEEEEAEAEWAEWYFKNKINYREIEKVREREKMCVCVCFHSVSFWRVKEKKTNKKDALINPLFLTSFSDQYVSLF